MVDDVELAALLFTRAREFVPPAIFSSSMSCYTKVARSFPGASWWRGPT
jgi:hypothetical protein